MIRMELDTSTLAGLAEAIRYEEDGKVLRKELSANLKVAVQPAIAAAKAGIMSMGSAGLTRGASLRSAIASQIKSETRLSGRRAGVRVRATKRSMPRGFRNAPKRTNSMKGWRHPAFQRGDDGARAWVHQMGRPGWFDTPMHVNAPLYRAAVLKAMEASARRISRRV